MHSVRNSKESPPGRKKMKWKSVTSQKKFIEMVTLWVDM